MAASEEQARARAARPPAVDAEDGEVVSPRPPKNGQRLRAVPDPDEEPQVVRAPPDPSSGDGASDERPAGGRQPRAPAERSAPRAPA
ncbi:MAG: hypothetical protein KGJ43_06430, partial [Acidobacteriota bacterium]|nr:hypothetical protein [Acidobacteriota bacterium]